MPVSHKGKPVTRSTIHSRAPRRPLTPARAAWAFALPLLALAFLTAPIAGRAQNAVSPSAAQAAASSASAAIAPKAFYKAALKDRAPVAPFAAIAAWQQDGSTVLLDLRSPHEFDEGHIPGAISLPATELTDAALGKIIAGKATRVVIYCANNLNMATRRVVLTTLAYPTLKQLGYTNVLELESAAPGKFPLTLVATSAEASTPPLTPASPAVTPPAPQALLDQIDRLTQLLRDRQAQGYAPATLVQAIKLGANRDAVAAVLTGEGFEGGNDHTQYLALFAVDASDKAKPYYRLLDCMAIGGKGWRAIDKLHVRVTPISKSEDLSLALDALEVGPKDAPNFPTRKSVIRLTWHDDRLSEKGPAGK